MSFGVRSGYMMPFWFTWGMDPARLSEPNSNWAHNVVPTSHGRSLITVVYVSWNSWPYSVDWSW